MWRYDRNDSMFQIIKKKEVQNNIEQVISMMNETEFIALASN